MSETLISILLHIAMSVITIKTLIDNWHTSKKLFWFSLSVFAITVGSSNLLLYDRILEDVITFMNRMDIFVEHIQSRTIIGTTIIGWAIAMITLRKIIIYNANQTKI